MSNYRVKQTIYQDKLKEPIKNRFEQDFEKFIKNKFQKIELKRTVKISKKKKANKIEIFGRKFTNPDEETTQKVKVERPNEKNQVKNDDSSPFSRKMKSIFEPKR